jgi:hypothetical protein
VVEVIEALSRFLSCDRQSSKSDTSGKA